MHNQMESDNSLNTSRGTWKREASGDFSIPPFKTIRSEIPLNNTEDIKIKDVLKNKKSKLNQFLELKYGLIDQLVSQGTCDIKEVKAIEYASYSSRRRQLANELVEKLLSTPEDRVQFLEILKSNNQRHLAVFVEQDGCRIPQGHTEFNCWPLDKVRMSSITRNMKVLVENLDPDNGLVRKWASYGCINVQQCHDIEQTSPQFERNRTLLNFLMKRSVADYNLFVDCLKECHQKHLAEKLEISEEQEECLTESASWNWKIELEHLVELHYGLLDDLLSRGLTRYEYQVEDLEVNRLLDLVVGKSPTDHQLFLEALKSTGQEHVASFITQNGCRYDSDHELFKCWPIDSRYESRIVINFCDLIDLMTADVEFINNLWADGFINTLQKCDVIETQNMYDKTRKLLNFLLQSSIAKYDVFVRCLKKSSQHCLAQTLEGSGVIETIDSKTSNGSKQEEELVNKYKSLQINDDINSILHEEVAPGVNIIDIRRGSVRCYLLCQTPTALTSLYQKLDNGSLAATMQSIFSLLLGCEDTVQVVQTKGRLSASELQRRLEVFSKNKDSEITINESEIGAGDTVESELTTVDAVTVSNIQQHSTVLPMELLKAAILIRNRLADESHKKARDADVIVLQRLASVCRRWKIAMLESNDVMQRRRLKRTFHYNPQLLVTLNRPPTLSDGDPRGVEGVAMLDNYLFVVYWKYNKVEMFDCKDRFEKVKDIEVTEMNYPRDIVASSVTSQLYISQWNNSFIWRVDLKTGNSDMFIQLDYNFVRLSLVGNRLLVASCDSLLVYDIRSGEGIKNISYTGGMKKQEVYHAIESNRDSFFVSHDKSKVSEIDSEGRVVRMFDNKEHLNCGYLALDSVGRLLVADYTICRVALLDEHLKFERMLFDKKRLNIGRPLRLYYNMTNNRLVVGFAHGQVKLFEYNHCRDQFFKTKTGGSETKTGGSKTRDFETKTVTKTNLFTNQSYFGYYL